MLTLLPKEGAGRPPYSGNGPYWPSETFLYERNQGTDPHKPTYHPQIGSAHWEGDQDGQKEARQPGRGQGKGRHSVCVWGGVPRVQ